MGSTTPLLDILSTHLPSVISSAEISSLNSSQTRSTVENLLSFAVGGECPTLLSDARKDWSLKQPMAMNALQDFLAPKGSKRARESQETDVSSSKRQKTTDTHVDDDDDLPVFTLPSISTTSPVRKKVDITVHDRSLRFINIGTRALEAAIPITSISRAFLLPTRGKSKEHWTVVLLPTDAPNTGKALAPSSQQVIFGLDALSAAKFETTSYSSGSSTPSTTIIAKGEETVASVRKLLSYLPVPLLEPSATVFRSACAKASMGNKAAGVDAVIGAKSGTLWFFDSGILWGEKLPCEFWAVSDLVPKDGVRLISATGRTCSVILSRKGGEVKDVKKDEDSGEAEEEEGEEVIETEFTAIDGKEQDPIHAWARHRKHLFGKTSVSPPSVSDSKQATSGGEGVTKGSVPNGTVKGVAWDDSDSDDGDFEAASSEDLDSSDSDDSEDGGGSDDENGGQSEDAEESGDEKSDEEEELQEAHHPLLRPGAMPRMSKAAMDAVVDMVRDDLIGDASDEEDELDE